MTNRTRIYDSINQVYEWRDCDWCDDNQSERRRSDDTSVAYISRARLHAEASKIIYMTPCIGITLTMNELNDQHIRFAYDESIRRMEDYSQSRNDKVRKGSPKEEKNDDQWKCKRHTYTISNTAVQVVFEEMIRLTKSTLKYLGVSSSVSRDKNISCEKRKIFQRTFEWEKSWYIWRFIKSRGLNWRRVDIM